MNNPTRWPKATKERPCPKCGKTNRCLIAPDGTGGICWRSGSKKVWQDPKPASSNGNGRQHADRHRSVPPKDDKTFGTPGDAIAEAQRQIEADYPGTRLTGFWFYQARGGADVMIVARYDDGDGNKHFRPMHPHKGGWRIGDPPAPLPLYRMTELPGVGPIYVCEGEKAADATVKLGLEATTSAHGAASADRTDWTPLAQHAGEIIILPDNDEPGAKYARDVTRLLFQVNPAARVKIVELPGLPEHGDIVEFIDSGGTREGIEVLAHAAAPIDGSDVVGGPMLDDMADAERVEIKWLWRGHIPIGRLTLLAGKAGEGKSLVTTDIIARITTGSPWADGQGDAPIGSVLMIVAEDAANDTIGPRLDAANADTSRGKVKLMKMVKRIDPETRKPIEFPFTLKNITDLEAALQSMPDCRLIVIDPIGSFLGGRVDSHRDNEVRAVLAPLAALAEKYGVAVLIVAHTRKALSAVADDLVLGSRAFTALARSVWHLTHDKVDRDRKLLLPGKCNLAKQPDGMAFTIGGDPPCISWEREPIKLHADDVLEQDTHPGPEPEARKAAEEWLQSVLATGPVPSGDLDNPEPGSIRVLAKEADLKWATVRRAADKLGVRRERDPFTRKFVWRLPKCGKPCCAPHSQDEQREQYEQQEDQPGKTEPKIDNANHVAQEDSARATNTRHETADYDPYEQILVIETPDGQVVEMEGEG